LLSKNAIHLLGTRYQRANESINDVFTRVSNVLGGGDEKLSSELKYYMEQGIFFPNSPAIYNAGYSNMLHACCALGIEDNMESIARKEYMMTMMFKYGAGVGFNFYKLRPNGAPLSTGGTSSGVISFLKSLDAKVDYVKQGGFRRGAAMGGLMYYHPEIMDFIQCKIKGGLSNFNLSVWVDDDFMRKVDTNESIDLHHGTTSYGGISAKFLFDIMCFCAWSCGCPGIIFFDRVNKDNRDYPSMVIDTTNPCSESPIPNDSLCTLASINLSKFVRDNEFNFNRFGEVVKVVSKALMNMNKVGFYPFPEMKEAMDKYNPFGVGIMGFADALIKLGVYYDSNESLDFIDRVGEVYKSCTNAIGGEAFYKRIIAPTGSLSILADCSSGIEPVFAEVFERHLTIGVIEETRDLYKSSYTRTADKISPEWHIKVQAQWQKWADGGISKTVNLPHNATVDDVKNAYKLAWKLGCKGVTIYRDFSKDSQVLYKRPSCSDETCYL